MIVCNFLAIKSGHSEVEHVALRFRLLVTFLHSDLSLLFLFLFFLLLHMCQNAHSRNVAIDVTTWYVFD